VVKIGSALLVDKKSGTLHQQWLSTLLNDLVECARSGKQVVIVSSGAIALGRLHLGLKRKALLLEEKQASAAIGQITLAHAFQEALKPHGISVAQILLTLDDNKNEKRRENAKHTLETLLKHNVIPVINENDAVATDEICYGDNDRLAANVAQMINADTLVLLSDIDGLYTGNPTIDSSATRVPLVTALTPEILAMAGPANPEHGSGGMVTKLMAAEIVMAANCRMVIVEGKHHHPLSRIDQVDTHTWFVPKGVI
jgi:glutamate 5-kinase